MVITFVAVAVQARLETVYIAVSVPIVTPVTRPPAIVARVLLMLQVPPGAGSESVMVEPIHTFEGPLITPASGVVFTVTICEAVLEPHELVIAYPIVSIPAITPVTTPPATVAEALLLLHAPPAGKAVRLTDEPVHTVDGPAIKPAVAAVSMVITFVAVAVQARLETVYTAVSVPIVTPVTRPPTLVARALLMLHVPPAAGSVSVMVEPIHTFERPLITPAFGDVFTVTICVAVAEPHELVIAYPIVSIPAVTPVTTPPATVAEALLLLHAPPAGKAVRLIDEPVHTVDGPVIKPALTTVSIVMVFVAVDVQLMLVTVYIAVSTPAVTPVTTPPRTIACVLLILHAPPAAGSVNVIEAPTQTLEGPLITPAFGDGFIVTVLVAMAVPQTLVTVYLIVSIPAVTPVTTPAVTKAFALLALQVPPGAKSVNVMVLPVQTVPGPEMLPSSGNGFTVTAFVAVVVPQTLVTV